VPHVEPHAVGPRESHFGELMRWGTVTDVQVAVFLAIAVERQCSRWFGRVPMRGTPRLVRSSGSEGGARYFIVANGSLDFDVILNTV
jgi:hypothetical protein